MKSPTKIGKYCRRVGLIPHYHSSSLLPLARNNESCYRKLLSSKIQLFLKMHNLESRLWRVTPDKIWDLATQFQEVEILFTDLKTRVNSNISDSKTNVEVLKEEDARFEFFHKLYENLMRDGLGGDTDVGNSDVELSAEDSTLQTQLTKCSSKPSNVPVKNLQHKIELEHQCAEISAICKRDLAKTKAAADAAEAKAKADADAANAEARFRFEEARLEAEEKLLELSLRWLSILSSRVHHANYRNITEPKSVAHRDNFNIKDLQSRGRKALAKWTPQKSIF